MCGLTAAAGAATAAGTATSDDAATDKEMRTASPYERGTRPARVRFPLYLAFVPNTALPPDVRRPDRA
jgi:hypothetical protein